MTTITAKQVCDNLIAREHGRVDGLLAKIAGADSIEALEAVLAEDDATSLVYQNASHANQKKIDAAIEERAAALA